MRRRGGWGRDRGVSGRVATATLGRRQRPPSRARARRAPSRRRRRRPTLASRPPGPADWAALRRRLSSRLLVTPDSSGYGTAKLLFDPKFDQTRPQGIAYCATASDVSACLDFVRRFGLPVAARSGGHSYGGWSSSTGLVIDVSKMSQVTVDASGRDGSGRGRDVADRPVQPAGRARAGGAGRVVPDGGDRRARAGRRSRRRFPALWPGLRQHRRRADRHRGRDGPRLHRWQRGRPVLGVPGRRRRQLRRRYRVHLPHPSGARPGAVLPAMAVVGGGAGDRRLAVLGAGCAR